MELLVITLQPACVPTGLTHSSQNIYTGANMSQIIITTQEELIAVISHVFKQEIGTLLKEATHYKNVMNEKEAAIYIGQSANTLRFWRGQGRGPAYLKDKQSVRYKKDDLDTWLNNNKTFTADSYHAKK